MKARFRPPAEDDVRHAYAWYREQGEGLAPEFRRALDACVAQIERNPLAYPKVYEELRRALLRRFPYGIFYISNLRRLWYTESFTAVGIRKRGSRATTPNIAVQRTAGSRAGSRTILFLRHLS